MAKKSDKKNANPFPGFGLMFLSIVSMIIGVVGCAIALPDTYFHILGFEIGSIILSIIVFGTTFLIGLVFSVVAIFAKLSAAFFPSASDSRDAVSTDDSKAPVSA